MLKEDKAFRRFSMISIDGDVQANIKAIQNQARQDNIPRTVNAAMPLETNRRFRGISCQQCRIVGSSRLAVKKRVRLHSSALRLRPPEGAAAIRRCLAESRSWFPENAVIG